MPLKRPKERRGQRDMSLDVHEWRFEVGAPDGRARLDAFLRNRLRWRSRTRIRAAIEEGRVEILPFKEPQRAPVGRLRAGLRLRTGQEVVVRLPAPQAEPEAAQPVSSAAVIFEDEHLIAIDKAPFRSVYPSRRHRADSLIEWVHARHRDRYGSRGHFPSPCHRLDRETSGLVLFAKSRVVRSEIGALLEQRAVRKTYLALIEGIPPASRGMVRLALGSAEDSRVEIKVGPRSDGRPAESAWRVVRRLSGFSLVELEPRTGRRHQLRVHMAELGHPIVGDKLYSGDERLFLRSLAGELTERDVSRLGMNRQALHAWRLEFFLESVGRDIGLEAPLPIDMREFLKRHEPEGCLAAQAG